MFMGEAPRWADRRAPAAESGEESMQSGAGPQLRRAPSGQAGQYQVAVTPKLIWLTAKSSYIWCW